MKRVGRRNSLSSDESATRLLYFRNSSARKVTCRANLRLPVFVTVYGYPRMVIAITDLCALVWEDVNNWPPYIRLRHSSNSVQTCQEPGVSMVVRPLPSLAARHPFAPVTILQLDQEGNIKLWNPAAEQMSRLAKNVAQTMERGPEREPQ